MRRIIFVRLTIAVLPLHNRSSAGVVIFISMGSSAQGAKGCLLGGRRERLKFKSPNGIVCLVKNGCLELNCAVIRCDIGNVVVSVADIGEKNLYLIV